MKHGSTSNLWIGLSVLLCVSSAAQAGPGAQESPAGAAPARVEPAAIQQAKEHYLRGEKLFALGRFRDARAAYEAAYQASPRPELLFNIGQCHRNLGNYEAAVFSFRQYLKHKPGAANREAVLELIQELEAAMERADRRTGVIIVDGASSAQGDRAPDDRTRWWLWGGGAAVLVAATAVLATAWSTDVAGIPESDLGNVDF